MRPRKIDLAFEWMQAQPRKQFHYRHEVWTALADLHPKEFAQTADCKTPWLSIHRDMSRDERFVRGDRGMFSITNSPAPETATLPTKNVVMPESKEEQAWIFQANPKFYRILEALQTLDHMQFLTNRYKDRIQIGDIVLLWMSGKYAGIYAQARVIEAVEQRMSTAEEAAYWADPKNGETQKPRVVLTIEKRFLGNPLLKSTIAKKEGLGSLMILRQPNGTNFRVDADQWKLIRPLLPTEESLEPDRKVLTWAMKRARGGKLYDQSCGELLERLVADVFSDGQEHTRDELTGWFARNYPLFKPITVQCHVEKYTTNFRSRVHYNAMVDHDLLFRLDNDWGRLRLYRPGKDPTPIYERADKPKAKKSTATKKKGKKLNTIERNRRLLSHLSCFGELTSGDLADLGIDESELSDWLDALLSRRPEAYVVTPLFLNLIEGDCGPNTFTTRLAARFMGEHLRRHAPKAIQELEEHVWSRFGNWHLTQPHAGDHKVHAYLSVPIREPRDVAASERLDLFAQLPPKVIGDLIREPDFLSEQQSWSADAASKAAEGPLSLQLRRSWKRPFLLHAAEIQVLNDGNASIGKMRRADVVERAYISSGLPLCAFDEWEPGASLQMEVAAERLLQQPLATAIVQFEVQRLFAGLTGDPAATIAEVDGTLQLKVAGVFQGPLWRHVRTLIEKAGYWPVGTATLDSNWAQAVVVMATNLERLGVVVRLNDTLQFSDAYQSIIKAHPGHPQNRGEKAYRIRLSQFLKDLQGGQA